VVGIVRPAVDVICVHVKGWYNSSGHFIFNAVLSASVTDVCYCIFFFLEQCVALGFIGRWLKFSLVFVHSVCEIKTEVISCIVFHDIWKWFVSKLMGSCLLLKPGSAPAMGHSWTREVSQPHPVIHSRLYGCSCCVWHYQYVKSHHIKIESS